MSKLVVMAQVKDAVKWEAGFRTHGSLFRSQTVTKPIDFTILDGNTVVICFELGDRDAFVKMLDSPETREAMAIDGVKRETVKVFVLDKEFAV